ALGRLAVRDFDVPTGMPELLRVKPRHAYRNHHFACFLRPVGDQNVRLMTKDHIAGGDLVHMSRRRSDLGLRCRL
ncbi:MAG: hypothetical protein WB698_05300, partial [Solirubrobacteraceae bacterium]